MYTELVIINHTQTVVKKYRKKQHSVVEPRVGSLARQMLSVVNVLSPKDILFISVLMMTVENSVQHITLIGVNLG